MQGGVKMTLTSRIREHPHCDLRGDDAGVDGDLRAVVPTRRDCPGRKTAMCFLATKRPARPHKRAIENRFTVDNVKGAKAPRAGEDSPATRRYRVSRPAWPIAAPRHKA